MSTSRANVITTTPTNPSDERADREYKGAIQRFFKEVFAQ